MDGSDPWADAPVSPRRATPVAAAALEAPTSHTAAVAADSSVVTSPRSLLAKEVGELDVNAADEDEQTQGSKEEEKEDVALEAGERVVDPAELSSPSPHAGSTESASEPALESPPAAAAEEDPYAVGIAPPPSGPVEDDGFDDFDDFDAPAAGPSSASGGFDDDGFGDFGDFEEGDEAFTEPVPEPVRAVPEPVVPRWSALSLRPVPPRGELLQRITAVLEPIVPDPDLFTDEAPRAVGGISQILTAESSRNAYAQLTTPPMLKPLDWTRSRVRRDHLISMGVPVNLDEVDSHRLSALPPLRITTSRGDVPPRTRSADPSSKGKARAEPSGSAPVSARPSIGGAEGERKYGLGTKPPLDTRKAEELCGLEESALGIMPLARLEQIQAELVKHTADASALLAYYLQLKDAQTHDAATYNGMISELISNAAKVKAAGSSGGGVFRRQSMKPAPRSRPTSMSASNTPRRSGSPGTF